MSAPKDWWVLRRGMPVLRGEKKDLGPFTHREARSRAFQAHVQGWTVELERRDAKGASVRVVVPVFPGVTKGSRPSLPTVAVAAPPEVPVGA